MIDTKRPLRVFLCHASGDKPAVSKLYDRLVRDGVDAWLDREKLIPGQDWQVEISHAVKNSDVVIVCLSSQSVTKEGYVQKEIKFALDAADEKPDGTIFIIPARLENCVVPERIGRFHWVDLYASDGYEWLFKALQIRANNLGISISRKKKSVKAVKNTPSTAISSIDDRAEASNHSPTTATNKIVVNNAQEQYHASFENSETEQDHYRKEKYGHVLLMPRIRIGIVLGLMGSLSSFVLYELFLEGLDPRPLYIIVGTIMGTLSGFLTDRFEAIKTHKEGGKAGIAASLAAGVGHYLGFPVMAALFSGGWSLTVILNEYANSSVYTLLFLFPALVTGCIVGYYSVR